MIKIRLLICAVFFFKINVEAQPATVITTISQYKNSVTANKKNELINLKKLIPTILFDLKYASKNNFTCKKLYKGASTTYMRYDPAAALLAIQNDLNTQGYSLKIFDAYRPYAVTKLMWTLIHDERYVANPKNGSGHNKGTSVDLTIVKNSTNTELNMGTGFDNFTDSAHHTYTQNFDSSIQKNRNLLKSTMEKYGFKSLETEWWHYSWYSLVGYDVIDIPFKKLKKYL
jgi:zinc D-Ala-D-Ala dipeptidase